mgnify:CR=1 FL=1
MNTFLEASGQVRTFLFLSRLAMFFGLAPIFIPGEPALRSAILLGGSALALICLALICMRIRCPACGARVLWRGFRTVSLARLPVWVSTFDRCPSCQVGGDELFDKAAAGLLRRDTDAR